MAKEKNKFIEPKKAPSILHRELDWLYQEYLKDRKFVNEKGLKPKETLVSKTTFITPPFEEMNSPFGTIALILSDYKIPEYDD